MKMLTHVVILGFLALGCSKTDKSQDDQKSAEATTANNKPQTKPTTAAPKPTEAPKKPMTKQLKRPTDDQVGQLDEGVGIAVGTALPAVELTKMDGEKVTLSALADSHGVLMVTFYRGGWCPFCNSQVRNLSKAYPEFQKRGITPILISVDKPDEGVKTKASWEIPFPVLSDSDLVAHTAFNVLNKLNDDSAARLAGYGVDLKAYSDRDHQTIGVPSIFVISKDKKVVWAHAAKDYQTRPSVAQITAALDKSGFKAAVE